MIGVGRLFHQTNLAVGSRVPKSPALGEWTFFFGGAVAAFHCHLTAASIRAFLASMMPGRAGNLDGKPNQ
jgi:hypothetical protein